MGFKNFLWFPRLDEKIGFRLFRASPLSFFFWKLNLQSRFLSFFCLFFVFFPSLCFRFFCFVSLGPNAQITSPSYSFSSSFFVTLFSPSWSNSYHHFFFFSLYSGPYTGPNTCYSSSIFLFNQTNSYLKLGQHERERGERIQESWWLRYGFFGRWWLTSVESFGR